MLSITNQEYDVTLRDLLAPGRPEVVCAVPVWPRQPPGPRAGRPLPKSPELEVISGTKRCVRATDMGRRYQRLVRFQKTF